MIVRPSNCEGLSACSTACSVPDRGQQRVQVGAGIELSMREDGVELVDGGDVLEGIVLEHDEVGAFARL